MSEEPTKKVLTTGVYLFLCAVFGLLFEIHSPAYIGKSPFTNIISSEVMQIVISLALTAASLFVILRKDYGPKDKHWAYATVGTILGFWLRGGGK